MTTPGSRQGRLSLVGLLAATLVLELLVNRVGARQLRADPPSFLPQSVALGTEVAALFLYHLASVMAVLLAALAFLRLLTEPSVIPGRPQGAREAIGKGVVLVAMVGFATLTILGTVVRLPLRLHLYLGFLFLLLVAELVRGAWQLSNLPGRARLWLLLFLLAVTFRWLWVGSVELDLDRLGRAPRLLLALGESLAVTLAVLAPGAWFPRSERPALPVAVGLLSAGAAAAVADGDWEFASRVAAYGFGLELPSSFAGMVLFAIAIGAFAATALALLLRPGTARLRGYGLLLIGLSGYQLELPFQLAAALVGLVCIIDSYLREEPGRLGPDEWRNAVRRVAALAGAREVVSVGPGGYEDARMHAERHGEVVEVRLQRRASALVRLEVTVGQAAEGGAPPLSLWRRDTPRLGKKEGIEVGTGDAAFDGAFVTYDARTLHGEDPVLGDDLRPRLRDAIVGWLGVWPRRGVRLRSVSPALFAGWLDASPQAGERVGALLDLLVEVKRRSG